MEWISICTSWLLVLFTTVPLALYLFSNVPLQFSSKANSRGVTELQLTSLRNYGIAIDEVG